MTRESVNNAKVLYRLSFDRSEVERAQEIYFLSSKLQQVMNNPTIPYEKKADILEKIFSKAGISEKLVKFFQVMCKHNSFVLHQLLQRKRRRQKNYFQRSIAATP